MKGLRLTACLLALAGTLSGCEGTLGKLMDAMRTGWAKVQSLGSDELSVDDITATGNATEEELAAAKQLETVPGPPLNALEKIQVVRATNLGQFLKEHPDELNAYYTRMIAVNKEYLYQESREGQRPKNLDSISTPPAKVGNLIRLSSEIHSQENRIPEYPVPNLLAYNSHYYDRLEALYRSPEGKLVRFSVTDRSGIPNWLKVATWYYLRKGYIPEDQQRKGYKFVGTVDYLGHNWVIWSNQGHYMFQSLWKNTYQIGLDGAAKRQDIALVSDLLNPQWLRDAH